MEALDIDDLASLGHKLQLRAAELLIKLKDECYSTKKVFNLVTNGVDELFNILLEIIKSKFKVLGSTFILSVDEVCDVLTKLEGNSVFEGVHTPTELSKFVSHKNTLVSPKPVHVSTNDVLVGSVVRSIPVETGYYVPFLSMLECLLNCPEVLSCIDNPRPSKEGYFEGPLDGYMYKNNPIVKKYPNTLAIGTYDDDCQCTDTASSQDVSVTFVYWCLLNLYPELRSTNRAIHLLACLKKELMKKYGLRVFLTDFKSGMQQLASEEGVTFNVMGHKRVFHGILLLHCGDNPASANFGGFKESHFAKHPCRQCTVTTADLTKSFQEKDFIRRSKEMHEMQVREVEEYEKLPSRERQSRANPSIEHGVNSRSVMMDIPHCDVTKCLPQDLMHDVILGTLKLELVCLLKHVLGKKLITLKDVNYRVAELVKYFGVNKPAPIEQSHLDKNKLRQSASETLALAYIMPFALLKKCSVTGKMESVCDKANLDCFILRLNLLDFEMSSEFSLEDINKLGRMIAAHHSRFLNLYPGTEVPKLHYEIHFPTQILLFGPLRQHWCFRFEGKHAYFKRIGRLIHNFVNIYHSFSSRHQEKQCSLIMLCTQLPEVSPYLKTSNHCGAKREVQLKDCVHQDILTKKFNLHTSDKIHQLNFVFQHGVHYRKESAVVVKFVNNVPICGEVVAIYNINEKEVFVYAKLKTETYDVRLNAYKVHHIERLGVLLVSDLSYHHHIPFIREVGANYILLPCKSYLASKY